MVNTAVNEAGARQRRDDRRGARRPTSTGALLRRADGNSTTTNPADAVRVGSGHPTVRSDCAGPDAAGVKAIGSRVFGTYFARILGVDRSTTKRDATAVAGPGTLRGREWRPLIPVTVPVTIVSCNNQNRPVPEIDPVTGQPKP